MPDPIPFGTSFDPHGEPFVERHRAAALLAPALIDAAVGCPHPVHSGYALAAVDVARDADGMWRIDASYRPQNERQDRR